jgi:hypothetical protein
MAFGLEMLGCEAIEPHRRRGVIYNVKNKGPFDCNKYYDSQRLEDLYYNMLSCAHSVHARHIPFS